MDDDQIGALRDFVSAAWHYLTALKPDAPARRVELCEAVGALLYALEGPLPDDPEGGDDPDQNTSEPPAEQPEAQPRVRVERFIEEARTGGVLLPASQGGTVIPLFGRRRRRVKRTKMEDR